MLAIIRHSRRHISVVVLGGAATLAALTACVGDALAPAPLNPAAVDDAASPPLTKDSSVTPPATDPGDAGVGDADANDAAPKRFCANQAPLTGVADSFCADFDGTSTDEGFTQALLPDGGALTRATAIFFSPPASLTTSGNGASRQSTRVLPSSTREAEPSMARSTRGISCARRHARTRAC